MHVTKGRDREAELGETFLETLHKHRENIASGASNAYGCWLSSEKVLRDCMRHAIHRLFHVGGNLCKHILQHPMHHSKHFIAKLTKYFVYGLTDLLVQPLLFKLLRT